MKNVVTNEDGSHHRVKMKGNKSKPHHHVMAAVAGNS
jgi:hypothetical protein